MEQIKKYRYQVANALLYLSREQIEKYVEIDKKTWSLKTWTHNHFNNEINELKSEYLTRQDEEVDDVIKNSSLVYNNQLSFW